MEIQGNIELKGLQNENKPSDILKGFLDELKNNWWIENASIDYLKIIFEFLPELLLQNWELEKENVSLKANLDSVRSVVNWFNHSTETAIMNLKQQILAVLK